MQKVVLKEGKEKSLLRRHPWIFSGAVGIIPPLTPGEIAAVYSASGQFLAQAYFHPENSLTGRVLSFSEDPIEEVLKGRVSEALRLRNALALETNAYRLINAEGDGIPGLVVDHYDGVLVIQVNTWGIEKLKPFLVEALIDIAKPKAIYEKSLSASRRQEGLKDSQGWLFGKAEPEIPILENGLAFLVPIEEGQKTGFFLDQREMRRMIGACSFGKRVLNCFSYSGGFSLYALKGGAKAVTSVDSCAKASLLAARHTSLNGFASDRHQIHCEDVFSFLSRVPVNEELVILDPPAFAKKRADVDAACQGYKTLNRLVLEKIPAASKLLTCSCSHYIDEALFQNLIFQAAREAGREVRILSRHVQAQDHPLSIYHPEGEYLKSLLLYIA